MGLELLLRFVPRNFAAKILVVRGGHIGRVKLPVEIWERNTSWTFKAPVTEAVESVTLDPDKAFPDINPLNNIGKPAEKKGY